MTETMQAASVTEAKEYALQHGGRYYVLAPETLAQVEAAEAAGGFEGGMSGASGNGGFSAQGSAGASSSSASETDPGSYLDPDEHYWKAGALLEGMIETVLSLKDLFEGLKGDPVGPVILVPKGEIDKWLHGSADDA